MGKESEQDIMQNVASEQSDAPKKKSVASAAVDTVAEATHAVKNLIKETVNIASPIKNRTNARYKSLIEDSKWVMEKTIIAGNAVWDQTPPKRNIGEITKLINGGVGKVTYVEYLRHPENGGNMRDPAGGGLVKSAFVEETLEPNQAIKTQRTVIKGAPTVKQVLDAWEKKYKTESAKVRAAHGY